MQIIKEISEQIEEELDGAELYIKQALKYKQFDKDLANTYYEMSLQEMQHANLLHEGGVRLIRDYQNKGNTIPQSMQAVYDYLHEKHIEKSNQIKTYQASYNG